MAKVVSFRVPAEDPSPPPYDFPNGFSGGQNISVAPDQIPPNCSPSMENVNYDDGGVITKRYGMSRVNALSWGSTPIQGMHQFYRVGISDPIFLIFHTGKLYSYDEATDTKTDLCTGDVLTFADNPIPKERVVTVGDKFYFFTGEEFLYYDGVNPVATVQSIAYTPIVAQGKAPDGTGGTLRDKFNHLSDKWRESFSSDGIATEYVIGKQYQSDGITPITLSSNIFKAYVYGVEKIEGVDFTFDRSTWKASFGAPPIEGTDNVEIQLEADLLMDQTLITKCTMAIEYGGKNDSRVMISGHPQHPNIIRFCAVYDPTYWPEDADFGVGSNALAVNGWGRMNEYLVTYKQPGDDTAQWYSEIDIDATGYVSFPTFGLNEEYGCVANRTVHSAQNGLLALSDKGVVWTWPSVVKGQANCKVVSRSVNGRNGIAKGLLDNIKADLSLAHAEVYMNKYMLFIKDKVWVLDLDYSDLANNTFCWYPYTGIYAKSGNFLIRNDRLYMGDKSTGVLYKSQAIGDDYTYTDNGDSITAWWTSPLMFLGGREWEKKFERINMTFKPTHGTEHTLSLISDLGVEDIPLLQTAGFFDARYFHAQYLNAGTNNEAYPTTQSEKIGYKGQYIQFRIKNSMLNRGLTMLSSLVSYTLRKQVK